MTPELVLASASPTRQLILLEAGIRFRALSSDVDEVVFPAATDTVVAALARQKAEAVASRLDAGLVLGCDSLLDLDGIAYGKPSSASTAKERWRFQRGREGVLHTGHVLIDVQSGATSLEVVSTVVRFGSPSDQEIDSYVNSGEPLDKAGAFTLEGRSSAFLRGIDGDAGNVRGLSVAALGRLLARQGWSIVDFWSDRTT
jgi:septum formation protein